VHLRSALLVVTLPLATFAALAACSSDDPAPAKEGDATAKLACDGLEESQRYACVEALFWKAFASVEPGPRKQADDELQAAIAAFPQFQDKAGRSLMHFRLGQLRLARALENGERSLMLRAHTSMIGEFDTAMGIHPRDGIIAPWKDAMEMALYAVVGDWEKAVPLAERGFENVALNPMGNTLSLSGTTIGFPLSTGVPQRTVALIDAWTCSGVVWCTENSERAPWARPGLSFHFAEAYARVGNREKTVQYLDQALASPGADVWPFRYVAKEARDDVDAFLGKFAKLGQDGSAFDIAYANQPYGCVFCHGK
jgi:hypothetical protein